MPDLDCLKKKQVKQCILAQRHLHQHTSGKQLAPGLSVKGFNSHCLACLEKAQLSLSVRFIVIKTFAEKFRQKLFDKRRLQSLFYNVNLPNTTCYLLCLRY